MAGYHVTEVKLASINSLDCGRGTNEWTEIIVQLLDGSQHSSQGHMTVQKFAGIVSAAFDPESRAHEAELYFEFGPQNGPLQRLRAASVERTETEIVVDLQGESAGCKPFLRAKAAGLVDDSSGSGCCGGAAADAGSSSVCCGGAAEQTPNGACCG